MIYADGRAGGRYNRCIDTHLQSPTGHFVISMWVSSARARSLTPKSRHCRVGFAWQTEPPTCIPTAAGIH